MAQFGETSDFAKLRSLLNVTKLQVKENSLYQILLSLIGSAQTTNEFINQQFPALAGSTPEDLAGIIASLTAFVNAIRSFSTIVVSGQANVVAEIVNDTLTFVAGAGVSITTDPLTDSITITATGAGGTVTVTGTPANGNLTKFSGASSITNGDLTGDVTTAGGLSVSITNHAVTFSKIQTIANQTLLGRDTAGSGDVEQVTISQALDWL